MTDLDVVELVAAIFGTRVQANEKGPHRTEYATAIKGSRAVELMRLLRPMMGARRQGAIDRALAGYSPPKHKLSFEAAERIRKRHADGESVSSLARAFNVSRPTIRAVRDFKIYPIRERFPWEPISCVLRGAIAAGTRLNWKELYWLAGWLEAEGSFTRPPPSSPRRPRITGTSCDEDVIQEVARLLRVKAHWERKRREYWSDSWRVLLAGGRAIVLMEAIKPVMHRRRRQQIEVAIQTAVAAGARRGWHESPSHRRTPDEVLLSGEI